MKLLVTGAAGFIGYFTAQRLLDEDHTVCGIDNLNGYYDIQLKRDRLKQLKEKTAFTFQLADIADREVIQCLFQEHIAFSSLLRYSSSSE